MNNDTPNLHLRIFALLAQLSPDCGQRWSLLSPIQHVQDDVQAIAMANDFWRVQLGLAGGSGTIPERACLINTMSPEQWWYDFSTYVVPVIVQLGLPQP